MIAADPIFTKESIGSFAMTTYKKLVSLKLLNFAIISHRIYRSIVEIYLNKLAGELENPKSMFKSTKLFMKTLPSLHRINKYAKNGKTKWQLF